MPTGDHAAVAQADVVRDGAAKAPANDADGSPVALSDRLRHQLRSSEEWATIGRMTAGIAQELNAPLTALIGTLSRMTELVGQGGSPVSLDGTRSALRDCVSVADRIKDLVGALRGVSHRDHRSAIFFDPARAIRNAAKVFAAVHHRECRLDLKMTPLPALHGSPSGLGQVILNLLQNGLEARADLQGEGQARLGIAATASKNEVWIAVTDDGSGIPDDIAPRLFQEFFTTKSADQRRGLGLYMSRQIIAEMRGSIDFESAPGKTTFRIRLPFRD